MKQSHIFLAISVPACAFVVWLYILTQIPADGKNYTIMGLFFTSLTVWIASLIASCLYYWRIQSSNHEVIYATIYPSLRQGVIIATTVSLLLVLKTFDIIGFWEIVLVILAAVLFEIALGSHKKTGNRL